MSVNHFCWKHIFESIRVAHARASDDHNMTSSPTIHVFERLLRETPEIAEYCTDVYGTNRNT